MNKSVNTEMRWVYFVLHFITELNECLSIDQNCHKTYLWKKNDFILRCTLYN